MRIQEGSKFQFECIFFDKPVFAEVLDVYIDVSPVRHPMTFVRVQFPGIGGILGGPPAKIQTLNDFLTWVATADAKLID